MKIGHFSNNPVGISETFIQDLIAGLKANHNEITFFCGERQVPAGSDAVAVGYSDSGQWLLIGVQRICGLFGRTGHRLMMKLRKRIALRQLNKLDKDSLPDVAYVDYGTAAVLVREFLVNKNIPFVVHFHGYDATQCLSDLEYVSEIRKVYRDSAGIIVASHHIRRLLILNGCDAEKIHLIRYGIDVESVTPKPWANRLKAGPSVIFVGRLTQKKHPVALLYAFRRVLDQIPECRFTIIGDGELRTEVERVIKALGLSEAVSMLGKMPREEVFEILNNHWVYAQHSVTSLTGDQEGFAISPGEAAAHEIAVVSTWHNGIPEHVIHKQTGLLVSEFNYEAMGDAIVELLRHPDKAQTMGEKGRAFVSELCVPAQRISTINTLLTSIASNKK